MLIEAKIDLSKYVDKDGNTTVGDYDYLLQEHGLTAPHIAESIKKALV